MKGYYEVNINILEYLFISYPCFTSTCPGKIVISLNNLYKRTRIQCPICKRECSLGLDKKSLDAVRTSFEYLYRQLRAYDLLPVAFSPAIAPKTVFLDDKPQDNT